MQAGSHPGSFSGNSRAFERAAEALREKYERDRAAGDPDARASLELASKFDAAAARARTREQERTVPPDRPTFAGHRLGRLVLWLTVGALVFAALLAIGALLGGDLGETEGRILLAVLSLWVFSLAFLGGARAAASDSQAGRLVGQFAQALAAVALVFSLAMIAVWDGSGEAAVRGYWSVVILSGASTHAALLLGSRRDEVLRPLVVGTLCILGILAALLLLASSGVVDESQGYAKATGVFAVLLALGDLLLPVVSRLQRRARG